MSFVCACMPGMHGWLVRGRPEVVPGEAGVIAQQTQGGEKEGALDDVAEAEDKIENVDVGGGKQHLV